MGKSKNKFVKTWGNQTEIGRQFNMSAIALGKFLLEQGLKNPATKEPSAMALHEGYARSTPLRNGIPFFMWNRTKLDELLGSTGHQRASSVEVATSRIFAEMRSYLLPQSHEKLESIMWHAMPGAFEEAIAALPASRRDEVRTNVVQRLVDELGLPPGHLKAAVHQATSEAAIA